MYGCAPYIYNAMEFDIGKCKRHFKLYFELQGNEQSPKNNEDDVI